MGKRMVGLMRILPLCCAVLLLFLTIMLSDVAFAQPLTRAINPTQGPPGTMIPVLGDAPKAITFLTQMITLAMQNGGEGQEAQLEARKQQIEALPKPKRGDRKAARLQNDKGLEESKKERYEQALQFFLTAYQLDAGDVEVVNNVGMAYLKTGNLPEAARYLGGALSLAPNRAAAWGNLAEVFARDSRLEEAVAAYALAYRYSKNKDATRRFLEAQTRNDDDPQVMQTAKAALALPLIGGRTESGEGEDRRLAEKKLEGLKEQPASTPPVPVPVPTPTPRPQAAEHPQQEAASQQAIQSAASRCTGDQIEKMINAGFSKQEIVRLCETSSESPSRGTLSREEVVKKVRAYDASKATGCWGLLQGGEQNYQALKEAGYISGWQVRQADPYDRKSKDYKLQLTEKGRQFLREGVGRPFSGREWEMLRCDFNSGVEVTGLTVDPGGVTATAEIAVGISEPLRLLGAKQVISGETKLRLYDDGWRVESVSIKGGLF